MGLQYSDKLAIVKKLYQSLFYLDSDFNLKAAIKYLKKHIFYVGIDEERNKINIISGSRRINCYDKYHQLYFNKICTLTIESKYLKKVFNYILNHLIDNKQHDLFMRKYLDENVDDCDKLKLYNLQNIKHHICKDISKYSLIPIVRDTDKQNIKTVKLLDINNNIIISIPYDEFELKNIFTYKK